MRDYGKVFSRIWESADFRALSEDGRTLALYLLTCQHGTIAGAFRVPDGYACEDLQWPTERVSKGFAELLAKGFANRCETTKWVWVIKFLEWNAPENPNQRKAAAKIAASVPSTCAWKQAFMRVCGPSLGLRDDAPDERLQNPSKTIPQPVAVTVAVTGVGAGDTSGVGATGGSAHSGADAPATRGSRLSADWALPRAWGDWAISKYPHWTAEVVRSIAGKFRNHWVAKTGKDAAKRDWKATWENWCDSGITQREHPPPRGAAGNTDSAAKAARVASLLGADDTKDMIDA